MKRRSFLKLTGSTGLITLITPTSVIHAMRNLTAGALEDGFKNPPPSARPFTWWHWMNGNITKQGITLDLEAMQRVGIGGVQCFNVGSGIPKGPVDYLGGEWLELTKHAMAEAGRLGLEFDMHNCPGWSSTGGPWITPDISMQQVVWSEIITSGGKDVSITLPKPFARLDYYKDTYVIAFPSMQGERAMLDLVKSVRVNGKQADTQLLAGADLSKAIDVTPVDGQTPGNIVLEFAEPFEARSLEVFSSPITGGRTITGSMPANELIVEHSDDGTNFTRLAQLRRAGNNVEMPAVGSFKPVKSRYYRLLVPLSLSIANIRLSPSDRILYWTTKANFPGAGGAAGAGVSTASLQSTLTDEVAPGSLIAAEHVLDISKYMDKDGVLKWNAPQGNWTILRMGHTAIGRRNNAAPESGAGLECDKYSRAAYDFHFSKMFENLLPAMKELAPKTKVGLLVDSYEVGMQNWTQQMTSEFRKRCGYDMVKYLPAMTGRIVGSVDTTERFLWDLRRTHADMMADNYHGYFAELCKKHGILSYTEAYNNAPFEEMQVGSKVNINLGEFWIKGPHFFPSVKLASSIAHVYGQRIGENQVVAAESFTGDNVHSKWQESPWSLKAQGDYMYTKGLNRFIFHRYAHQPHPTALPGMTMGPWGFHFDRTNTWFEKSRKWLDYAARCQGMLQQGLFVADILFFSGDDGPGDDLSMMYTPKPTLPKGYDFDFINKDALLNRVGIKDGNIVLPDGMRYRLMVLPGKKTMTIEVLRKLAKLVDQGMVLIGLPPERTPGLAGAGNNDELKQLVKNVWGDVSTSTGERTAGLGKVFWGSPVQEVLNKLNIKPDFEYAADNDAPLNYVHRTIDNSDIYFIANRRRTRENILATFRISGKQPELWNPATGEITLAKIYEGIDGRTNVPLQFDPAGSVFVIFRKPALAAHFNSVQKDGVVVVSAKTSAPQQTGLHKDVTNSFTISTWVKPETDENFNGAFGVGRGPSSNVFYPPEGELLYGQNHASCGLIAARNGFIVYERAAGSPNIVLTVPMPVSGWTHTALVYSNGVPKLYINGTLIKEGTASGKIIHPGTGEAPQDNLSWFFEGDMSEPALYKEAYSNEEVSRVMGSIGSLTSEPPVMEQTSKEGFMFWQNGKYTFGTNRATNIAIPVKGVIEPLELTGPWTIRFPPNLGAPAAITLHKLESLHKHPDKGVKYFSGTATYTKVLKVPAAMIGVSRKLFLDLGRVEVIAEVKINGKSTGVLWKPPFRTDITSLVKAGDNKLEIEVTNLWPNRLIGDEQLAEENEYGSPNSTGVGSNSSGAIRKLPEWYTKGIPKPAGGRVTFTTWKHYNKDSPLLESGLIGPVVLRNAVVIGNIL